MGLTSGSAGDAGAAGGSSVVPVVAPKIPAPAVASTVGSSPQGTSKAEGRQDIVSLGDAAKCEVYVCFEGPLGAHLKQEVREKLWKGEYVEIFSLLLLEKCNLDRVKPDDSKKEDEELVTCVRDNGKCHRGEESRTLFGDLLLPGCYRGGLQGLWRYRMAAV